MTQNDLLQLLHDIKQFDIQNLSLDLPQDIRARIERALIGWGDLTPEQKATDALRSLMDALPAGTQTSMTVFRPEVNGQKVGTVKAFLMADHADDLRCAQWVITQADFISPRTRRLIQAYQDGDSVAATAAILLVEPPTKQHWD